MPFQKGNTYAKGKGRPKKAEEEKANKIFATALRRLYNKEEDDEAKVDFVQDLLKSTRGQIFVAEHVFGKPKESVDVTSGGISIDFKDLIKFGSTK